MPFCIEQVVLLLNWLQFTNTFCAMIKTPSSTLCVWSQECIYITSPDDTAGILTCGHLTTGCITRRTATPCTNMSIIVPREHVNVLQHRIFTCYFPMSLLLTRAINHAALCSLRAGIQPTLDPSTETFISVQCTNNHAIVFAVPVHFWTA